MPSQPMQDLIDAFRDRQKASASQAPPTLEERRTAFAPGGRLHPVSSPAMLRQFASDYLAGADSRTPLASPLFASLSGLPPLLIQVGTADLLLSDSERLAAAAAQAEVDVTLRIGEGLPHVYQIMLGTPEAAEAAEQTGKFLRARVRQPDSPSTAVRGRHPHAS